MISQIVVVGASAGGVEALKAFVGNLPHDLRAPVLVVLHLPDDSPSVLPDILSRAGPLPAHTAVEGEELHNGRIYVAPPGTHLMVANGHVRLATGPKENGVRPAVDVLFRSAAHVYAEAVVAVILSGTLADGAAGMNLVRNAGGAALIQDPTEAIYPSMPESAIATAGGDEIAPVAALGSAVQEWLAKLPGNQTGDDMDVHEQRPAPNSDPSPFSCPDCGGVLWLSDREPTVLRCRVGHAWGAEALVTEKGHHVENALWAALRLMEERAELSRRLADQARDSGRSLSALSFDKRAATADEQAAALRSLLDGKLTREPEISLEPDIADGVAEKGGERV